jgi:hypothetical protein
MEMREAQIEREKLSFSQTTKGGNHKKAIYKSKILDKEGSFLIAANFKKGNLSI